MSNFNSFHRELLYNAGFIPNETQVQYNIACPFHNETNGNSLSINFNKNVFKCFSGKCESKGISGSIERLLQILGIYNSNTLQNIKNYKKNLYNEVIQDNYLPFDLEQSKLYQYSNKLPQYLLNRYIKEDVIVNNNCFYSDYTKRVYIPYYFNNTCYGLIGRIIYSQQEIDNIINETSLEQDITLSDVYKQLKEGSLNHNISKMRILQKYINTKELPKKETIYEPLSGLNRDLVIICEGQINSLSCLSNDIYSIALLGSQPSINQVNYINYNYKNIILAFDNDKAGINATKRFNMIRNGFTKRIDWNKLNQNIRYYNLKKYNQVNMAYEINDLNDLNQYLKGDSNLFKEILLNSVSYI
jgi:hypothetical protein